MSANPVRVLRWGGNCANALEFAPEMIKAQARPPSPLPRAVLYAVLALFGLLIVWAIFGRLDIVAVSQGKLVPQTFLKIVQPAEPGIVREILVKEGDTVREGQVLARMDTRLLDADRGILRAELLRRDLQLRRIDAELSGDIDDARRTGNLDHVGISRRLRNRRRIDEARVRHSLLPGLCQCLRYRTGCDDRPGRRGEAPA